MEGPVKRLPVCPKHLKEQHELVLRMIAVQIPCDQLEGLDNFLSELRAALSAAKEVVLVREEE